MADETRRALILARDSERKHIAEYVGGPCIWNLTIFSHLTQCSLPHGRSYARAIFDHQLEVDEIGWTLHNFRVFCERTELPTIISHLNALEGVGKQFLACARELADSFNAHIFFVHLVLQKETPTGLISSESVLQSPQRRLRKTTKQPSTGMHAGDRSRKWRRQATRQLLSWCVS